MIAIVIALVVWLMSRSPCSFFKARYMDWIGELSTWNVDWAKCRALFRPIIPIAAILIDGFRRRIDGIGILRVIPGTQAGSLSIGSDGQPRVPRGASPQNFSFSAITFENCSSSSCPLQLAGSQRRNPSPQVPQCSNRRSFCGRGLR